MIREIEFLLDERKGKMRLLPSEKKEKVNEAKREFYESGSLSIFEPCDCGNQIRHNNGGNYHDEVFLRRDGGQVFVKRDTTCELVPPAEWEVCPDWQGVIAQYADWL